MPESLGHYLDFAVETAYLAGRLTLGYFQTGVHSELKADQSLVTVADRRAEELIRGRIEKQYPGHAIVGEEYGRTETAGADHRWFVDPIDGTASFVHGVPLYSVLIALEIEGVVQVGVAYFPGLNEMLSAATGQGCWWNGRRASVAPTSSLAQSVVTFSDVANFAKYGRSAEWQ
ncbi:MAG: inositol monophosphatase family protein, partial [Anaerolineae bacterium]